MVCGGLCIGLPCHPAAAALPHPWQVLQGTDLPARLQQVKARLIVDLLEPEVANNSWPRGGVQAGRLARNAVPKAATQPLHVFPASWMLQSTTAAPPGS